ncbi:MAG: PBP1A family penicillin-binding protein, partial [Leptolyngbyaceae cyanobacterium SL_1_1]|nr:PBP1A family penicillin-binding protein [Leptolyngbyaceae cyanobacterium SL_1_1]
MTNFITKLRAWSQLGSSSPEISSQSSRRSPVEPPRAEAALDTPPRNRQGQRPPQPYRRPLYFRPLFWLVLIGGAAVAGGAAKGYRIWQITEASLPVVSEVLTYQRTGTITLKASDGAILQKLGPATREGLSYDKIPEDLIQAFIAAEDRRFYEHDGVDYQAIARASLANFRQREVVEGASTITQQLARTVFLTQERSFQRKLKEVLLARKIEQELSKDKILERYLNLVYLGAGAYGVADAAWIYFGKSVDQLTLAESALIAGMAPAPSVYSPLSDPEAARRQRNLVIQRMLKAGLISTAEADTALAQEIATTPKEPKYLYSEFPYFTIYVQKQLSELLPPEAIEAGGLTVETTLNVKRQKAAEATVRKTIEESGQRQRFEQAAIVAIDPRNGEIQAMIGGNDFNESQFNRVTQAQRQPGSTFKALVYTTAIAAGFSPYKTYTDAKYVVDGYEPKNYGDSYRGDVSLRDALKSSINIVAVKTLVDVGFDPVIKMAHRLGIKSELQPTYSLALGASEVNLLELTSAYGTLAAQGKHAEPHGIRRVLNRQGEVIYEMKPQPEQAVDPNTAAIVTWMLQGVVQEGTGRRANLGRPIAGKTGTSERNRDLWFVGYMPQLVVGVWLGNDDSSPTWGASSTAAYTWRQFVENFIDDIPVEDFPELPRLSGRKGSIKAEPVKPGKVTRSQNSEESDQRSANEERPQPRYEPEPQPSSRDRSEAAGGESDSPRRSDSGGTPATPPQPENNQPVRPAPAGDAPPPAAESPAVPP